MTVDKVDVLNELLTRAIQSIVIRDSRRGQLMDSRQYTGSLKSHWDTHRPSTEGALLDRYAPHIVNDTVAQELIHFLTDELRQQLDDDRVQIATIEILGGMHPGIRVSDLLKQLLKVALVRGPLHTAQAFCSAVAGHPILYQKISLLNGIRIEQEIEISGGIRLVPLPHSSAELPNIFPHMDYMGPIDLLGRTVLVNDFLVSPSFLNPAITTVAIEDSFEHTPVSADYPNFDIGEYCEALSMSCNGAIQYIAFWTHLAHDHVINVQGRAGSHRYLTSSHQSTERVLVTEEQARQALNIYDSRKNLGDKVAKKLKVPIDRWIKSKANRSFEDSMIDIGIALEALFLSDNSDRSELGYRLRLRAAWYLGENVEDKVSIENDLKKMYDLRSRAVHRGNIFGIASNQDLKTIGQTHCLNSILKVIEDGRFPDWNRLVLGGHP